MIRDSGLLFWGHPVYIALFIQLSNRRQLVLDIVTASEAYRTNGMQYILISSTVTISEFAAFDLKNIQLKTR